MVIFDERFRVDPGAAVGFSAGERLQRETWLEAMFWWFFQGKNDRNKKKTPPKQSKEVLELELYKQSKESNAMFGALEVLEVLLKMINPKISSYQLLP